ncbi:heparan-alpha-glucosaminide N-acetyltransferase domain-containing protein [Cyclobacterium sp. 1_MG-2023]|uniref:acyltransferase family protein n=1 Tax=Cyclobacterium sp. 1_MG-2023 TaxID=3062681 RepID=UPI0026E3E5CA|nr:heparan-alpha-glucosaminide N-acetyltransferase domain-containing protein [Cyclobacterium sp. 1_MG-2023]MDO6436494.1 heparan-alpha-glucosaminide N-acetyltransferase domain-containing protein [Cyclobacterium sp. 1_MG-2023]
MTNTLDSIRPSTRYQSLDVLRGLTLALMVIVNTPGDGSTSFGPLTHADWHGLTLTDLVFPSFLFVVGNAMSFSLGKFKQKGSNAYFSKVLKRTVLIFIIGLLLTAFPFFRINDSGMIPYDFMSIRILGVLQRIALCYGLAATLIYFLSPKKILITSGLVLLSYWLVMFLFGIPGMDPLSLEGNASGRLDLWLFSPDNLYKMDGVAFDPEGLLSTFPAMVNVMLGYWVGLQIQKRGGDIETVLWLAMFAVILLVLGYVWDYGFPINKKIWTSSFTLVTVGYSTLTLAVLMFVLEVRSIKGWAYFFEVFGKNPLALYILSGVLVRTLGMIRIEGQSVRNLAYKGLFEPIFPEGWASLLFSISFMLIIWLIGWWMDKNRWYIKV